MRCPECKQTVKILESRIFDFTTKTFGCRTNGHWPGHTAKVYIDNVELVECKCGVTPNVPYLDSLQTALRNASSAEAEVSLDPFSNKIYVSTWDAEEKGWVLSQYQEQ